MVTVTESASAGISYYYPDNLQPSTAYVSPTGMMVQFQFGASTAWVRNFSVQNPSNRVAPPSVGPPMTINSFFDIFTEISIDSGSWGPVGQTGVSASVTVGFDHTTGTTSYYNTELSSFMMGSGGILLRESPTRQSTGSAVTETLPAGWYQIDSFFDVFLECSMDGGNSWSPATARSLDGGLNWTPIPLGASLELDAIPETGGIGLALLGMALLGGRRR